MAQNRLFLSFLVKNGCSKCRNLLIIKLDGSLSEYYSIYLPENGSLHYLLWSDYLNFAARSIISTWKDAP